MSKTKNEFLNQEDNQDEESYLDDLEVKEPKPTNKSIKVTDFSDPSEESDDDNLDPVLESELNEPESQKIIEDSSEVDTETTDKSVGELTDSYEEGNSVETEKTDQEPIDQVQEDTLSDDKSNTTQNSTDSNLDDAVDDIVRAESDEILEKSDNETVPIAPSKTKTSLPQKFKKVIKAWWNNHALRYSTIVIFGLALILSALIPVSRYALLNLAGVRVSSSMKIIDSQTRLPLKNIKVNMQNKSVVTDKTGTVEFTDLKLGSTKLVLEKRGYAENSKNIILGWGSNPIGDQELVATGEQFTFILTDWLSNNRVSNGEANSGENSASSDDDGKIVLTIGEESIADLEVTVGAEGYRSEQVAAEGLVAGDIEIDLVPDRPNVFVSNRNGDFDIYKIDLDGKNEKILLGATKKEREVPAILQHRTENYVAIVSSRDGIQNADGYVLDGLSIVDVNSGIEEKIGRSEQIQLIGWSGDYLVYSQVVEGTSRGNSERSKVYSYNNKTGEKLELAAANYFNDVELVNDVVTYAVSSFAVPQSKAKVFQVKVDGNENKNLLDLQVYTIFRDSYTTLLFNGFDQKWFRQTATQDPEPIDPVASPENIVFTDSPSKEKTAWVEIRDGKGVLLVADTSENSEAFVEQKILERAGVDSVQYWAGDETLVFQVIRSEETANYVINLDAPNDVRKIVDVTASKRSFY